MQLITYAANWVKLNLKAMKIHWVFVENSAKFFYFWILYSLQSKFSHNKICQFSFKIIIIFILSVSSHTNSSIWLIKWLLVKLLLLLLSLLKLLTSHSTLLELILLCLLLLFSKFKALILKLSNSKSILLMLMLFYSFYQILRIQSSSKKYLTWSLQTQFFMNERIWCWLNLNITALTKSLLTLTVLLFSQQNSIIDLRLSNFSFKHSLLSYLFRFMKMSKSRSLYKINNLSFSKTILILI